MLAISIFSLIPAWQILRNRENVLGNFTAEGSSFNLTLGAIYLGEVSLLLGFILLLPILLVKEFVIEGKKSPLGVHPVAIPEETVVRIVGVIVWLSAFLWISFHLFFLRLLLHPGSPELWWGTTLHFVAGHLYFLPIGVAIAWATRILIIESGGAQKAKEYFSLCIIPFAIGYTLFLLLPNTLGNWAPEWVESVGMRAGGLLHLLQFPIAVWRAAVEGSGIQAAGWFLLLLGLAALGGGAVWRWRPHARFETTLEGEPEPRRFRSLRFRSHSTGSRCWREFRLFLLKDSLAPFLRVPLREIRTHGLILTLLLTGLILLDRRTQSGEIDQPISSLIVSALVLTLAGIFSLRSTAGKIGTEGRTLILLRPILTPQRLFSIKCSTSTIEALLLTSGYTLITGLFVLASNSLHATPLLIVLEGIGWVVSLSPLGSALGFLFPDFQCRGLFLRGASALSKILFTFVSGVSGALYLMGVWLAITGVGGIGARWTGTLLAGTMLLVLNAFLIPLAIRTHARRVL